MSGTDPEARVEGGFSEFGAPEWIPRGQHFNGAFASPDPLCQCLCSSGLIDHIFLQLPLCLQISIGILSFPRTYQSPGRQAHNHT